MAIKSTIFKANLSIADIDHGYYADHNLTLARHPSETDDRMMVRLVALALNAWKLQDLPQRHWTCRCGEMVEGGFEQCWNCGAFMPRD